MKKQNMNKHYQKQSIKKEYACLLYTSAATQRLCLLSIPKFEGYITSIG